MHLYKQKRNLNWNSGSNWNSNWNLNSNSNLNLNLSSNLEPLHFGAKHRSRGAYKAAASLLTLFVDATWLAHYRSR